MSINMDTVPHNVSEYTGAIFFGNVFNFFLMGALFVQGHFYYQTYRHKDRLFIQCFPAAALLIQTLQTVLVAADGYILFGQRWGHPSALFSTGRIWLYAPILGSLMGFVAQAFYAWRVKLVGRNWWLPGIILAISLTQFIGGLITGIMVQSIDDVTHLSESKATACVWLAGSAIADLLVSGSMLWFLKRSRTGFKRTDALISQIISISLETGLLCAIMAFADLIVYVHFADKNWHLCIANSISKLYANSLLTVLNSRAHISASSGPQENSTQGLEHSNRQTTTTRTNFGTSTVNRQPFQLEVTVAREVHKEGAIHVPMMDLARDSESQGGEKYPTTDQ